jgi:hypothetical protein
MQDKSGFELQFAGYGITAAHILYRIPDFNPSSRPMSARTTILRPTSPKCGVLELSSCVSRTSSPSGQSWNRPEAADLRGCTVSNVAENYRGR